MPNCTCGPQSIDGKIVQVLCDYHARIGLRHIDRIRTERGWRRPVCENEAAAGPTEGTPAAEGTTDGPGYNRPSAEP